jgi:Mycobacterium 19 kDa lipoprotein antigen
VNRLVKVAGMALVVVAGVAGCGKAETVPRGAAHLTLDGTSRSTRPPACSRVGDENGQYQTIDIRDHEGQVEAVVLISADRVIPKWVKIRNIDGFNGSAWAGGVGETHVDLVKSTYTITGSAYGISSKNPNKVVTPDFKIVADC